MITHDQFPSFLYWCEFIQKIFGHYRRLHMNITQKNQRSLNKRSLCLNVWVNDSFDRQHFNQCNVWQNMIIVWIVFCSTTTKAWTWSKVKGYVGGLVEQADTMSMQTQIKHVPTGVEKTKRNVGIRCMIECFSYRTFCASVWANYHDETFKKM